MIKCVICEKNALSTTHLGRKIYLCVGPDTYRLHFTIQQHNPFISFFLQALNYLCFFILAKMKRKKKVANFHRYYIKSWFTFFNHKMFESIHFFQINVICRQTVKNSFQFIHKFNRTKKLYFSDTIKK